MVDILGYRATLGFIITSTNTVMSYDACSLSPPGMSVHFSDALADTGKASSCLETATNEAVTDAACRMETRRVGVVGLTFDTALFADKPTLKLAADLESRLSSPVILPTQALAAALNKTGWGSKVGLLAPFTRDETKQASTVLKGLGCDVIAEEALNFQTATAPAHTTFIRLRQAHQDLLAQGVEHVIQLGHNLPFGKLVNNLEEDFGKPILSINAVCYWHMLRTVGIADIVPGAGKLLLDY